MAPPISQAAYARHRGVSRVSVHRWVQQGKIALTADGKIDATVVDLQLPRPLQAAAPPPGPDRRAEMLSTVFVAVERSFFSMANRPVLVVTDATGAARPRLADLATSAMPQCLGRTCRSQGGRVKYCATRPANGRNVVAKSTRYAAGSRGKRMTALLVTENEKAKYWEFVGAQIAKTGRPGGAVGVAELYHYTSGEGLVGIIESGDLWVTQASCLNDATEVRYAAAVLLDSFQRYRGFPLDSDAAFICDRAIAGLSVDAAPKSEWFVACLSEEADDLSQWRAYGRGEGGYAIGFDVAGCSPP
jgi:hypothetical protein